MRGLEQGQWTVFKVKMFLRIQESKFQENWALSLPHSQGRVLTRLPTLRGGRFPKGKLGSPSHLKGVKNAKQAMNTNVYYVTLPQFSLQTGMKTIWSFEGD